MTARSSAPTMGGRRGRAGAAALLLALLAAPAPADDEIVDEFKKYFRKYEDVPTRVEAIRSLEGATSPEVVEVLVPILDDDEPEVVRAAVEVLSMLPAPAQAERVARELEKSSDDAERVGLLRAVTAGGYASAREAVLECVEDRSWPVRRRAVLALCALGGEGVAEAVLPLVEDPEVAVRCAVLDGLAELGSETVVDPAIAALGAEEWQVRASAIQALASVRRARSIAPLIDRMEVEEGRLVHDIGQALEELTGRSFGERVDGWRRFWETWGDRYVMPTDEEIAAMKAAAEARRQEYAGAEDAVVYHGVESPSRAIVFVIDVSGSMENLVVERERFEGRGYPSFQRIDIVKTELCRTLEGLEDHVQFNILAFATEVKPWKDDLVRANVLNKSSAIEWVGRLEALGGHSKEDLHSAGLVAAANLEAGKTNSYAALTHALRAGGRGLRDEHYRVEVDTIFFLSDGRPSHGEYVEPRDILREVNEANALRKIVIHTIAIGEFQKSFMRELAGANGGAFVDLGR